MLEKIKQFAETVKSVLIYVIAPLAFVAGYIYVLITENTELRLKTKLGDENQKVDELFEQAQKAQDKANDKERTYNDVVSKYLKQHGVGPDGKDDVQ